MDNEFQEYPKAMHGPDGAEAVVSSAEEEKGLGKGWIDGHEHWAAKVNDGDESEKDAAESDAAPKKRGPKKKDAAE
jgi:hypothetical protein